MGLLTSGNDLPLTDAEATDAELIGQSVGEPSHFAAIFDRHADEILRYVHARLGPDLAEDVTAETFLAAFRQRERYDQSRADARPWLYGIAIRQIGTQRRAEGRGRRTRRPGRGLARCRPRAARGWRRAG